LKDVLLTSAMAEWVLLNVLRFHRQDPEYRALQQRKEWLELSAPSTAERRIGILGIGELGSASARILGSLGFPVMGWSRSAKTLADVQTFHGTGGLMAMAAKTDILICLLPLTPETRGVLNTKLLSALPRGAYVINGARGGHMVAEDMLAALDSGHIAGAALDVFEPEPLPTESRFWSHPKVFLTPHAASITIPSSVAPQVVENIHNMRAGRPLINLVDFSLGY
jgi:glyoxylate/hydroxypyruvate reductase A